MKIVFLVYDSRSGSTFLSNLIMRYLDGVVVTPEIGLEYLIKVKSFSKLTPELMLKRNYLRNLNLTKDEISLLIRNSSSPYHLIINILNEFLKKTFPEQSFHTCIIKYGKHIFLWKNLLNVLGSDLKFIHIYRDPRAVINSKLKTIRPYYPFETFAWGGPLVAAYRWYQYIKEAENIKNAGVDIYEICYENLLEQPKKELKKLSFYLGVEMASFDLQKEYIIPTKERNIHNLVGKSPDKSRMNKWREELSLKDTLIVEAVLYSLMSKKGYYPLNNLTLLQRVFVIIKSIPSTIFKIARHFLYHLFKERLNNRILKNK